MTKIVNLRLTLLSIASLLLLTSQIALAENIYIKGEKARFRSGPSTNYAIIWEAQKYYPLEFLATYKDWYVVRDSEGDVGWVHSQVVRKGIAAIVTSKKANVRQSSNIKSNIKFKVYEGYPFLVKKRKGDWIRVVDAEGENGWIHNDLVWMSK